MIPLLLEKLKPGNSNRHIMIQHISRLLVLLWHKSRLKKKKKKSCWFTSSPTTIWSKESVSAYHVFFKSEWLFFLYILIDKYTGILLFHLFMYFYLLLFCLFAFIFHDSIYSYQIRALRGYGAISLRKKNSVF